MPPILRVRAYERRSLGRPHARVAIAPTMALPQPLRYCVLFALRRLPPLLSLRS
jgi:hypothetical protein